MTETNHEIIKMPKMVIVRRHLTVKIALRLF